MSAIDVESFRPLLEQERERIAAQIAHLHDDNSRSVEDELGELTRGLDNHLGDMASVTFDRELDEGLEEGAQQTLAQIERAIAKLDDGTYGQCERGGTEIPEARLRARPWALLCIDDQRLVDRG
jgi:RNA polymerase-binding transcription factor DksA